MEASRSPTNAAAALLAVLLCASGCRFAPDLSAWTPCNGGCPTGYRCLETEQICLPECGESGEPCEVPVADAGPSDGGADAGPAEDGGEVDAGPDAGEPEPLALVVTALEHGSVGQVYAQVLHATGGVGSYRFAVVGGGIPEGLFLQQEGTLGGTPTVAGASGFVVQVTDEAVPQNVAARAFTLVVDPAEGTALSIETEALAPGVVSTAYAASFMASGGTEPFQWRLAAGNLPAGLTLSSAGALSGTPSTPGESTFDVSVRDSSLPQAQSALGTFTLRIEPATGAALAIATTSLPAGTAGTFYHSQLEASGGTAPYQWRLAGGGSLPGGLELSQGAISGTPTAAGATSFVLEVLDSSAPQQIASRGFSIAVSSGEIDPLTITTSSLPDARTGVAYDVALSFGGGTAPVSFALASGSLLPPGIALETSGRLTGTPTASGSFGFGVVATDSSQPTAQTATRSLTLTVSNGGEPGTLAIATTTLPDATVGLAYHQSLQAIGGTEPYSWSSSSGTLPTGLNVTSQGDLEGTPSSEGTFHFSLKVTDSGQPAESSTRSLTLVVQPSGLALVTSSLPAGQMNVAYQAQLAASGGTQPYAFHLISGQLPQGLTLCESSLNCSSPGMISGTPRSRGRSQFEAQVSDNSDPSQSASRTFSIDIN